MFLPAPLHAITINARSRFRTEYACARLVASLVVHVFDVESVDVTREVAQYGQEDVDEEVGAAACDEEDADGGNCGGC